MSLIDEIHNQKPAVRHTLFVLSVAVAFALIGLFGVPAIQRELYATLHTPEEQAAFAAQQDQRIPDPLAFISHAARSLTASIGSLLGFDPNAGFDKDARTDNTQDGVHLLPLSE